MWAGLFISFITGGCIFLALAKFHQHMRKNIQTIKVIGLKNKFDIYQLKDKNGLYEEKPKKLLGLYLFDYPINSFLHTYSMLLLVSLPKLPEGWSLRIFTGWWWIYCILVAVAYRASMISILANPTPR